MVFVFRASIQRFSYHFSEKPVSGTARAARAQAEQELAAKRQTEEALLASLHAQQSELAKVTAQLAGAGHSLTIPSVRPGRSCTLVHKDPQILIRLYIETIENVERYSKFALQ